jgi:hypothetical protein
LLIQSATLDFLSKITHKFLALASKELDQQKKPAQGRVFALNQQDAQATGSVIHCTIRICGTSASILVDPGSTHSFVSPLFVPKNNRVRRSM